MEDPTHNFVLTIKGMSCASCVSRVENSILKVPGVESVSVNLATEQAYVSFSAELEDRRRLLQAVRETGYIAELPSAEANPKTSHQGPNFWPILGSAALSVPLLIFMLFHPLGVDIYVPAWLQWVLATAVQFLFGGRFYVSALKALRGGSANMDVLVALGTTAAYFLSCYSWWRSGVIRGESQPELYFEVAAIVVTLVMFGKWLEARAKRQTTAAIWALRGLRPEFVLVRDSEKGDHSLPIEQLQRGTLVVVKPGERIAVDGLVREGFSHVDESLITGESFPVLRQVGDRVVGGSLNGDGLLLVEARHLGVESTLARMIRLVEEAQAGKPPIQKTVDRVSAIFVPFVILIAALTLLGWWFSGAAMEVSIFRAVAVLVIACPCALGLATPTAIMVGTGTAARFGILFRDVQALELAHRVGVIAFDKTGTLTQGKPVLIGSDWESISECEGLEIAAALQAGSDHPLSKAFASTPLPAVRNIKVFSGKGLEGVVGDETYLLGSERLMQESGCELGSLSAKAELMRQQGASVSWVARRFPNRQVMGFLAFQDPVKPGASDLIQELCRMNIEAIMITGDHEGAAARVASELGIKTVYANMLPDEKVELVKKIREDRNITMAMVGDGLNDAPALAAADVSFAMASGTDVAMEAAGVTLMRSDPIQIIDALDISGRTLNKIKQNLFWAFIYNVIGVPAAALGFLNPMLAGAAMALSSVSVVTNSLLLRTWRPKRSGTGVD
jgi:Cu+-exporting ATPase